MNIELSTRSSESPESALSSKCEYTPQVRGTGTGPLPLPAPSPVHTPYARRKGGSSNHDTPRPCTRRERQPPHLSQRDPRLLDLGACASAASAALFLPQKRVLNLLPREEGFEVGDRVGPLKEKLQGGQLDEEDEGAPDLLGDRSFVEHVAITPTGHDKSDDDHLDVADEHHALHGEELPVYLRGLGEFLKDATPHQNDVEGSRDCGEEESDCKQWIQIIGAAAPCIFADDFQKGEDGSENQHLVDELDAVAQVGRGVVTAVCIAVATPAHCFGEKVTHVQVVKEPLKRFRREPQEEVGKASQAEGLVGDVDDLERDAQGRDHNVQPGLDGSHSGEARQHKVPALLPQRHIIQGI
mmetsp:Transcript_18638/g.54305  ORF Transcript_18638/g.54305 Transcript_18638/m.54305 type:complete len:355 (-) Transcript_18638:259-1323(-)